MKPLSRTFSKGPLLKRHPTSSARKWGKILWWKVRCWLDQRNLSRTRCKASFFVLTNASIVRSKGWRGFLSFLPLASKISRPMRAPPLKKCPIKTCLRIWEKLELKNQLKMWSLLRRRKNGEWIVVWRRSQLRQSHIITSNKQRKQQCHQLKRPVSSSYHFPSSNPPRK